ncbi:hypothetical protein DD568_31070 [Klebsiella pneumoniae]|nr:hypothetical protein DD568_31070 [Klebsiella pneumoniae]
MGQLVILSDPSTQQKFDLFNKAVCVVKWRRKPGVAGCRAINSATLPPALISLNSRTAMKKSK